MTQATNTQLSRSDIAESIRQSMDWYGERDGHVAIRFHFGSPRSLDYIHDNASVQEVRDIFVRLGFSPQPYDTVMMAFDLNQDWYVFTCDKCIRDYGFALPVVTSDDDIDALARVVELAYEGKVIFLIEQFDRDDPIVARIIKQEAEADSL